MKSVARNALFAAIILAANLLHAQLVDSNVDWNTASDDQVLLQAIELTTPIPPDQLPTVGATFYSARHSPISRHPWPALPGNINDLSAWNLGRNIWILDDKSFDYHSAAIKANNGTMTAMDDSEPPAPGSGGGTNGGDYDFTNSPTYSFPTNGLWLQITNVADSTVYANINGATDYVYVIYTATNLLPTMAVSNWNIETEVFPGVNTNTMPFTVQMNGRNPLFLWAGDWTDVTANGNQTPLWWLFYWFGAGGLNLSDTNLDSSGNTLLSDYQTGIDPDAIQFSISVTNQYVNIANPPIQLNVTAGEPFYIATVVDSTDFTDAVWNAYTSSNITVNLGPAQGWHNIWVGLRGFPANAPQTWLWQHLYLATPPLLVVTNPATSVVDEPVIQIYGYCQESLASISYNISNSMGVSLIQSADITDQYFDTNAFGITTNYFECLDVPITNGLNTITFYATDLAGDTTTTNVNFTLDYSSKTNPPVLCIAWPQNGTQVSGSNFTCTGWVSDPTAAVTAFCTNASPNGISTNTYTGEVGRNGSFSFENLPLNTGTNAFTISAADVVGNTSVTNISIVQTNFVLTINPVSPASQLWQPTVNLTGTISDPTYAVWVNGVKGTNNGNGIWSANNVPANNGSFGATAYAPNEQQPDGSYGN